MPHPRLLTESEEVKGRLVTVKRGVQCVSLPLIDRYLAGHRGTDRIVDANGERHSASMSLDTVCWTALHSPNPDEENEFLVAYKKAIRAVHLILDTKSDLDQPLPKLSRACDLWVTPAEGVDENVLARKLTMDWPQLFARIHLIHPRRSLLSAMYNWAEGDLARDLCEGECVIMVYTDQPATLAVLSSLVSIPIVMQGATSRFCLRKDSSGNSCFHAISPSSEDEFKEALEKSSAEVLVLYRDAFPQKGLFAAMLQAGKCVRRVRIENRTDALWKERSKIEVPPESGYEPSPSGSFSQETMQAIRTVIRKENALAFSTVAKDAEGFVTSLCKMGFQQNACCWLAYETITRAHLCLEVRGETILKVAELESYREIASVDTDKASALFLMESQKAPDLSALEKIPLQALDEVYSFVGKMARAKI